MKVMEEQRMLRRAEIPVPLVGDAGGLLGWSVGLRGWSVRLRGWSVTVRLRGWSSESYGGTEDAETRRDTGASGR